MRVVHSPKAVLRFPDLTGKSTQGERKMGTKAHNGVVAIGDVLVYEAFGTKYGHRILQSLYVSEVNETLFIAQAGKIAKGENSFEEFSGGKDLSLLSMKELKWTYPNKWVKDSDYKDGDVLVSKDGGSVFIVRGSYDNQPRLQRITPGAYVGQGYDRLSFYEDKYGPLVMLKTYGTAIVPFSAPVTPGEKAL